MLIPEFSCGLHAQAGRVSPAAHLLLGVYCRKSRKWKEAHAALGKALELQAYAQQDRTARYGCLVACCLPFWLPLL